MPRERDDTLSVSELGAIAKVMNGHGIRLTGPLKADLIAGGRSNLTFRLTDIVSRWVLRTPPRSGRTPSAHDVARVPCHGRVARDGRPGAAGAAPPRGPDIDRGSLRGRRLRQRPHPPDPKGPGVDEPAECRSSCLDAGRDPGRAPSRGLRGDRSRNLRPPRRVRRASAPA